MTALLTLIGVVLFVVGILVSVGLHEVGHMLPGQGVRDEGDAVLRRFRPDVWSFKRGETEYGIKAIPAGGFVRIIGMMPPAKRPGP